MKNKPSLFKTLKDFTASEKGTVLPLFGLALFAVLGSVGIAIDYGRAQMVQGKLHSAIDAAGLAAATVAKERGDDERTVRLEVTKFATANFPQNYMGTRYSIDQIDITQDTISIRATGAVDTSFMRLFGKQNVNVAAFTQVTRGTPRTLELVMVLDNSGSMRETSGGISKRNALVNGAKEAVNTLAKNYEGSNFYVGTVPFNQQVNVGAAKAPASSWGRANSGSSAPLNSAIGCLNDKAAQRPVAYATTTRVPEAGNTLFNLDQVVCDTTKTNVKDFPAPPAEMTPLTGNVAQILKDIDSMREQGNTRIDLGAIWAWRMLDPGWKGKWRHAAGLPAAYKDAAVDKVAILFTDGNNVAFANKAHPAYDPAVTSAGVANKRLADTCVAMKTNGIIIYTIVLQETNATTNALMKACATAPDYYFFVASNQSVAGVFKKIVASLSSLRISQ